MHTTTFLLCHQTTHYGYANPYNFIYGDNGVVALNLRTSTSVPDTTGGGGVINDSVPVVGKGTVLTENMYYIHTDHLGSYCALTNALKEVVQRNCFDPWGNVRYIYVMVDSLITMEDDTVSPGGELKGWTPINFTLTNRGFTGHEHYPYFKIINMNGRLYDPVIARFFSPDKYVANSSFTQDFNRYTYARNNPLMYTDPSGEFFFFFPTISWSGGGGLGIGLNFIYGIPRVASFGASIGFNLNDNDFSATISATAAFNTVYASYGTQSGFSVGWNVGISPQIGLPLSSNITSVGVNYNFKDKMLSGNISAFCFNSNGGMSFNPSFSVAICPQQFTNLVRGQGFRNNSQVFDRMMDRNTCQEILDYFGFKGTYVPGGSNGSGTITGKITYNDYAFEGNYDRLAFIASHEMRHSSNTLSGKYKGIDFSDESNYPIMQREEWDTYLYNYRNQGLYPNHGENLAWRINSYGMGAGIYKLATPTDYFIPEWWHFIYKIPRLW